MGKVPKRRWHHPRYLQQAVHAGIHGNHPGPVTLSLIESVEILPNPHTYPDQQKRHRREGAKACHKQIQCSTQLQALTKLEHNTREPCKTPYKTPNVHDHPNTTEQHLLESHLAYLQLAAFNSIMSFRVH